MILLGLLVLTVMVQAHWPTDPVTGVLWRPGAFWSLTLAAVLTVAAALLLEGRMP